MMKFTLGKAERLKSKKLIDRLYEEGTSIKVFPLRMVFLQTEHTSEFPAQVGVSVSKRNFKNAVDRNRIKRLMREAYRKQKHTVYNELDIPYIFMISYLGKTAQKHDVIEDKMDKLLVLFLQEIKKLTVKE
ncbi:MAG: ribonuclease P protein component [Polaribacter sp.]|nr:ribonuclease P protein component [Polaribacter sp.]